MEVQLLKRHFAAAWYVLTVILPVILRTGRRPVVFSRFAGLGDILCTFPAALELKQRHPAATFIYNCAPAFACLPRMGGVTERVTHLEHAGLIGYWYRWLLAGYYDFGSDDDQFSADHGELFIKGYARRNGVAVSGEHPRLRCEPAVIDRVKSVLTNRGWKNEPLILIHPGPTWPVKEWPRESWAALVQAMQKRGKIFQLGATAGHFSNVSGAEPPAAPGAVSLVNQLSVEESLALVSLADLFVGIDSGLLHAAVCFQVPAVGIWGATSPQFLFAESELRHFVVSRAECQGCHHRFPRLHHITGCPYDIRCMKEISVAEVLRTSLKNFSSSSS